MANMSFLPEDYLAKRVERRTNATCLVLFVIVLSSVVCAYFVSGKERSASIAQLSAINTEFEQAATRLGQLEQLQERKEAMVRKGRVTAKLIEPIGRWLILSELVNNMPDKLALLEFKLETKVSRQPRSARATTAIDLAKKKRKTALDQQDMQPKLDVSIELTGIAPTDVQVAKFMRAINANMLFDQVNLSFSEEMIYEDRALRKFKVLMKLAQQVNLAQFEPTQIRRHYVTDPMHIASESQPLTTANATAQ